MRKKLLALLMCATMVLGSSAVAFAAPSDDDWKAAGKVLSKGSDITAEYESTDIKAAAYVAGVGTANYAFVSDAGYASFGKSFTTYDAVKLNSDNKALLYVGDAVDLTSYGTITSYTQGDTTDKFIDPTAVSKDTITVDTDNVNISVVLEKYITKDLAGADLNAKLTTASKTWTTEAVATYGLTTVIVNVMDNFGNVHVRALKASDNAMVEMGASDTWTDAGVDLTSSTVYGVKSYVSSDGYAFTAEPNAKANSFFKATKATGSDGATYAYTLSAITTSNTTNYSDIQLSIAEAIADGTLSTDARAVKIKFYQYYVGSDGTPVLKQIEYPNATVSLPVANDLLSRTGLKAQTVDAYFVSDTMAADTDLKVDYNKISKAASTLDASAAYKTFDLPLTYTTGNGYVVIFDKSADESQNDGVASEETTTTAPASETAASSPKTGDVAPIAALAVVMMGACGAMVVASKKRA